MRPFLNDLLYTFMILLVVALALIGLVYVVHHPPVF